MSLRDFFTNNVEANCAPPQADCSAPQDSQLGGSGGVNPLTTFLHSVTNQVPRFQQMQEGFYNASHSQEAPPPHLLMGGGSALLQPFDMKSRIPGSQQAGRGGLLPPSSLQDNALDSVWNNNFSQAFSEGRSHTDALPSSSSSIPPPMSHYHHPYPPSAGLQMRDQLSQYVRPVNASRWRSNRYSANPGGGLHQGDPRFLPPPQAMREAWGRAENMMPPTPPSHSTGEALGLLHHSAQSANLPADSWVDEFTRIDPRRGVSPNPLHYPHAAHHLPNTQRVMGSVKEMPPVGLQNNTHHSQGFGYANRMHWGHYAQPPPPLTVNHVEPSPGIAFPIPTQSPGLMLDEDAMMKEAFYGIAPSGARDSQSRGTSRLEASLHLPTGSPEALEMRKEIRESPLAETVLPFSDGEGMNWEVGTGSFRLANEFVASLQVDPITASLSDAFDTAFNPSAREDVADTTETSNSGSGQVLDAVKARQLAEDLRQIGDDKQNDSQFLKFVEDIASGDMKFDGNTLRDSSGNSVVWENNQVFEAAYNEGMKEAEDLQAGGMEGFDAMERLWAKATERGHITDEEMSVFKKIFEDNELREANDQLNEPWEGLNVEDFNAEQMSNAWLDSEKSSPQEDYQFKDENPFEDIDSPLTLAQQFIAEGKINEAILSLEAEVKRNPDSSEGWRLLGQTLADIEQDKEAITCLTKGHNVDPYNLNSLLALGVSLTNELDANQALKYLKRWLTNHDDYQAVVGVNIPDPPSVTHLMGHVQSLFEKAIAVSPNDPQLRTAIGVICNIGKNYDEAVQHFFQALRNCSPEDAPSLWNKIGATLANSGRSEAALIAYNHTIKLKPHYPRAWANLGVAHANLGDMESAIRFYLSSLNMNPNASHLWYYIRTAILSLGNYDLLKYEENQDAPGLRHHIKGNVIDSISELPAATICSPDETEAVLRDISTAL